MEIVSNLVEVANQDILDFVKQESEQEIRERLIRLQECVGQLEQIDLPLVHRFAPGVYAREIFLPKGSVVVGKIHKHDHLNFFLRGDVSVYSKDGLTRISAPCTFVSTAGTKRAVYAHEDSVWTTIHVTNETDLEKIEDYVIAKSFEEFEQYKISSQNMLGEQS